MERPKLFVMAMYAMKLDPERLNFTPQPDGTVRWELKETLDERAGIFPAVSLWAVGALASSEEQAREAGMQQLLEQCPWQEGWVNHHLTINAIPREILSKAVHWSREDTAESEEEQDLPELLM
ncbi:MAG TPA: hypothetical protein VGB17_02640 [Pyrinomonadaceae bacterium]|jgi:hypothetical protein